MDVGYFLKERTKFIRFYYDEAVRPFVELKRKIEDQEPPFDNPPYSEDPEPPYLDDWMEADTAINIVGLSCVSLLSDTVKLYFQTLQTRVIGFKFIDAKPFQEGFPRAFKSALGDILNTDWGDCPADWAIIEQIVLARNKGQHGTHFGSFDVHHDEAMLAKHPSPFFVRPQEKQAWDAGERTSFLSPSIIVTRETLFAAVEQIEALDGWIQSRMDHAWEWRRSQA